MSAASDRADRLIAKAKARSIELKVLPLKKAKELYEAGRMTEEDLAMLCIITHAELVDAL